MRGHELLDKMALIDPAYVEAAAAAPKKRPIVQVKWGAAAACLALAAVAVGRLLPPQERQAPHGLPMLTIAENASDAMGYEGYMAYDISELINANPWREAGGIAALPVYQNPLREEGGRTVSEAELAAMRELLLDVAGRLGACPNDVVITDNAPSEEERRQIREKFESVGEAVPEGYFAPTALILNAEGFQIEVDRTLTATIHFEPAVSLPDAYHFTHDASYEETLAVARYLQGEYAALIGMADPQPNVHGGDYNIYGQRHFSIEFFEGAGSEVEQILHYHFERVAFYCDDDGALFLAKVYRPDLSDKVGEYPIIRPDEAKELLVNGQYLSSVPYAFPGAEFIQKVELIYRTGSYEAYYMPYYRFYVELPEAALENGLKDYGAYYVPAVESAYIANMPTGDALSQQAACKMQAACSITR